MVDMFVAQQAQATPPVKRRQKEKKKKTINLNFLFFIQFKMEKEKKIGFSNISIGKKKNIE